MSELPLVGVGPLTAVPAIAVPTPTAAPSVLVAEPGLTPVVMAVRVGSIGPEGPQGPIGITTGFGQVTYSRALPEPGEPMAEGVPTRLVFDPDPALAQIFLNPPFAGHTFWDGSAIRARAFADRISVQVNLRVRAQRAGGTLLLEVDAGSPAGPIVADGKPLFKPAGAIERVTLDVEFQTIAFVIANGGALILTSTVPVTILRKTVLVAPESIYVGAGP